MRPARIAHAWWRARRLNFTDRDALQSHQARQLERFRQRVLTRSPYFAPWLSEPLSAWPLMDKATMMQHFDRINTAGLRLNEVLSCAMQAEHSRDFSPTLHGYSVGLSSGTSGSRGVFVTSAREQAQWAGTMLAKLLPHGLRRKERVALLLRSGNRLYNSVHNPCLAFSFFDLFAPFERQLDLLADYAPTIVVAPAQVLCALALAQQSGRVDLAPVRAISVAEVLQPQDRALIAAAFGDPGEIYQATEGFLAVSCPYGTLHLNEAFLQVEPEWIDEHRFVPIITDFTRSTQPIVRYRLDDILVRRAQDCPCGSAALALDRIEGRCDDTLRLPAADGRLITVFADVLSRAFAQVLPLAADYRLIQTGPRALSLHVESTALAAQCQRRLQAVLNQLGVDATLTWTLHNRLPDSHIATKRRRIIRMQYTGKRP